MVEQSESVVKLFAAVVAAGGELRNPPKDSVNPHFKSRYADLATVLDTVRPVLARHKLAVMQMPTETEFGPGLATVVVHESGEWMRSTVRLYPGKLDPQGIGSAMTYARRYGIQAALGIAADDDDDGHTGSRPAAQQAAKPAPTQAAKPATAVTTAGKVWSDHEANDLMGRVGWDWTKVLAKINANNKTNYSDADAIPHQTLNRFCDWLSAQPY